MGGFYCCHQMVFIINLYNIGVYGTAVHLPQFSELLTTGSGGNQEINCIFSEDSTLFGSEARRFLSPIEEYVPSCNELNEFWTYLVALMSLSFIGLVVSIVGIISNCITPCVEDHYQHSWKPGNSDV